MYCQPKAMNTSTTATFRATTSALNHADPLVPRVTMAVMASTMSMAGTFT